MSTIKATIKEALEDRLVLAWESVEGADVYRVEWADADHPGMRFLTLKETGDCSMTVHKSTHRPLYFRVKAFLKGAQQPFASSDTVKSPVVKHFSPRLEKLGRGLAAVHRNDGIFLSWRLLLPEVTGWNESGMTGADFAVYKNGARIARVADSTNYLDQDGTMEDSYAVAKIFDGVEEQPCAPVKAWRSGSNFLDIPLKRPEGGVTPAGEAFEYHANDMSVGDVDGDGEYEYFLKWDPSNSKDVSQKGYTGRCIIDCYKLDGRLLWRLDMGPNIRAGAHYTQFIVMDFNLDGKAEMAVKTAPGTKMTRFNPDGSVESEAYITMPAEDLKAGFSHADNYVCSAADYRENLVQTFLNWEEHPEVVNGNWPKRPEACFGVSMEEVLAANRLSCPADGAEAGGRASGCSESSGHEAKAQREKENRSCAESVKEKENRDCAEALADYFIHTWAPSRSPRNDLTNFEGFIFKGPEYLTMFSGDGRELQTIPYPFPRLDDGLMWGDYSMKRIEPCNRVDRFLAGAAYLDGERPYLIMSRGYYTRATIAVYSFFENRFEKTFFVDSGFPVMRNPFDDNPHENEGRDPVYGSFAGQGNHSLSTADVDGDGKQEIVYGAAVIDDDGSLLYSSYGNLPDGRRAKLGHGDSFHVAKIDPDYPGFQIFNVFEGAKAAPYGYALRDAATGEVFFGEYAEEDLGRCMIGKICPEVRGWQVWCDNIVYDCHGNILPVKAPGTNQGIRFAADLTTQVTDFADMQPGGRGVVNDPVHGVLLDPEGTLTNNYTKGNPCLVADVLGDFRENLLLRLADDSAIRLYISDEVTHHKLFTLMHDLQYRSSIAWQNNCYNQTGYPSFYYGPDMDFGEVLPGME